MKLDIYSNHLELLVLEKQHNQILIKLKKAYTSYGIGLFYFFSKNQSHSYSLSGGDDKNDERRFLV
ncbi:hypothetical protein D0X99_15885 [Algoriphagus lacus]|uniref:Uncharacterized protein n=1 Tax=Algoriphagus lacus TaxID=2056311 RepID=A0A418PP62_9BACT|nr:hypothetical protein D0X99_15885 [Algoriphagus lacus]